MPDTLNNISQSFSNQRMLTIALRRNADSNSFNFFFILHFVGTGSSKKINIKNLLAPFVLILKVGTVKPVEDFLDIINQKDEDRFDAGKVNVYKSHSLDELTSFGATERNKENNHSLD